MKIKLLTDYRADLLSGGIPLAEGGQGRPAPELSEPAAWGVTCCVINAATLALAGLSALVWP